LDGVAVSVVGGTGVGVVGMRGDHDHAEFLVQIHSDGMAGREGNWREKESMWKRKMRIWGATADDATLQRKGKWL
jgi:hypothetical protein